MQVFILLAFVGLAYSFPQESDESTGSQYKKDDGAGNYHFAYDDQQGAGTGSFRSETGDASGSKTGTYGIKDHLGNVRVVSYVADDKGFRAQIQTKDGTNEDKNPLDVHIQNAKVIEVAPIKYNVRHSPVVHYYAGFPNPESLSGQRFSIKKKEGETDVVDTPAAAPTFYSSGLSAEHQGIFRKLPFYTDQLPSEQPTQEEDKETLELKPIDGKPIEISPTIHIFTGNPGQTPQVSVAGNQQPEKIAETPTHYSAGWPTTHGIGQVGWQSPIQGFHAIPVVHYASPAGGQMIKRFGHSNYAHYSADAPVPVPIPVQEDKPNGTIAAPLPTQETIQQDHKPLRPQQEGQIDKPEDKIPLFHYSGGWPNTPSQNEFTGIPFYSHKFPVSHYSGSFPGVPQPQAQMQSKPIGFQIPVVYASSWPSQVQHAKIKPGEKIDQRISQGPFTYATSWPAAQGFQAVGSSHSTQQWPVSYSQGWNTGHQINHQVQAPISYSNWPFTPVKVEPKKAHIKMPIAYSSAWPTSPIQARAEENFAWSGIQQGQEKVTSKVDNVPVFYDAGWPAAKASPWFQEAKQIERKITPAVSSTRSARWTAQETQPINIKLSPFHAGESPVPAWF